MRVSHGLGAVDRRIGPGAVTIGFFDGVHLGHQAVIRRTVAVARAGGLTPTAVTFDRHPREVLTPGREPALLTTLERKGDLIAGLGIESLVVLPFTEELATWPAERFATRVLSTGLAAEHVVVGSNFTFGHGAAGDLVALAGMGTMAGFTVEGVSLVRIEGRPISSSSIRTALAGGDLRWPAIALGRRYAVEGTVVAGAGRGTGLGYPTANLDVAPRILLPGRGVYAALAFVGGESHGAAVNIGTNPTFGGGPLHVEAHVLDFAGDLHGRRMTVEFWARLRDEVRFPSAGELVRQMGLDVERARTLLAGPREDAG